MAVSAFEALYPSQLVIMSKNETADSLTFAVGYPSLGQVVGG